MTSELRQQQYAPRNNFNGAAAPGLTNDSAEGYVKGSYWFDQSVSPVAIYICTDPTAGAAVWEIYGSGFASAPITQTRAPLPTDDLGQGYSVNSLWQFGDELYKSFVDADDSAVWYRVAPDGVTVIFDRDPTVDDDVTFGFTVPYTPWLNSVSGQTFTLNNNGPDGAADWLGATAGEVPQGIVNIDLAAATQVATVAFTNPEALMIADTGDTFYSVVPNIYRQYPMSNPGDITTVAGFTTGSGSGSNIFGMDLISGGTRMYHCQGTNIRRSTLATPYDIDTIPTFNDSGQSFNTGVSGIDDCSVVDDESYVYTADGANVRAYNLVTAGDVTTAVLTATFPSSARGVDASPDGKEIYFMKADAVLERWSMATPNDLANATLHSSLDTGLVSFSEDLTINFTLGQLYFTRGTTLYQYA